MISTIKKHRKSLKVSYSEVELYAFILGLLSLLTIFLGGYTVSASTDGPSDLGTPGLYANPESVPSGKDLQYFVTVTKKPSESANIFWSNSFSVSGSESGYTGFQTVENKEGKNLILFSVWGATDGEASSENEGYLVRNTDGAPGVSARIWRKWEVNHEYKFEIKPIPGRADWWNASITDMTTGEASSIGNLKFGSSSTLSPISSWVEYFNWSDPKAVCGDQEPSTARFSPFIVDDKIVKYNTVTNSDTCIYANHSFIESDGSAVLDAQPASINSRITDKNGNYIQPGKNYFIKINSAIGTSYFNTPSESFYKPNWTYLVNTVGNSDDSKYQLKITTNGYKIYSVATNSYLKYFTHNILYPNGGVDTGAKGGSINWKFVDTGNNTYSFTADDGVVLERSNGSNHDLVTTSSAGTTNFKIQFVSAD